MADNRESGTSSDSDSDISDNNFGDSDFGDYVGLETEWCADAGSDDETEGEGEAIEPYRFEPYASESDTTDIEDTEGSGDEFGDRLLTDDWCSCGHCQAMETRRESICCQEIDQTREKCEEVQHVPCITEHPDFNAVCLNRAVLDTAYYQYRQQYNVDDSKKRQDEKYRHVACRQLCRWCWKLLGKDIRRVLPSCAVFKIRETFPSPTGQYQGFKLH